MKEQFWPGTKIPKSQGNAFDWRGVSLATSDKDWRTTQNLRTISKASTETVRSFTIYSKARKSK